MQASFMHNLHLIANFIPVAPHFVAQGTQASFMNDLAYNCQFYSCRAIGNSPPVLCSHVVFAQLEADLLLNLVLFSEKRETYSREM